jgi:hypothetical protein
MNKRTLLFAPRTAYTAFCEGSVLLLVCVFFLFVVSGCKSAPKKSSGEPSWAGPDPIVLEKPFLLVPVSSTLLGYMETDLTRYQYYVSSLIVLVRESTEVESRNINGTLDLVNIYNRNLIKISGDTRGAAVKLETGAPGSGVTAFEVGFEPDAADLTLRFVRSAENSFELEVREGMVRYGDEFYRLVSVEKPVKLLVNLETHEDIRDNLHIVPGRTIDNTRDDSSVAGDAIFRSPLEQTGVIAFLPSPSSGAEKVFRPDEKKLRDAPLIPGEPAETPPRILPDPVFKPEEVVSELAYIALPSFARIQASPEPARPAGGAERSYRVQVGAFTKDDNAKNVFGRLSAAGFNPVYERKNGVCRVIISGVAAEDLSGITRRLDSAGFHETWIQEEN